MLAKRPGKLPDIFILELRHFSGKRADQALSRWFLGPLGSVRWREVGSDGGGAGGYLFCLCFFLYFAQQLGVALEGARNACFDALRFLFGELPLQTTDGQLPVEPV